MPRQTEVGQYLIKRLTQMGLGHVFGVPGDYVLRFYDMLVASPLGLVCTCTEAGAGFAADAYARINGLGAVCVTYCVGGFNTLNAVAGAYAERSPLVVISGAPGVQERIGSPLLHHRVRDYRTQQSVFEKVTCMAVAVDNPQTAPAQIDEALAACVRHKRPVYLELPRDIVAQPCAAPGPWRPKGPTTDPDALAESIDEANALLARAKRPAILAGVEIHRFGLQRELERLVERTGYSIAATLLGKSVIAEQHPQYLGVYAGRMGRGGVRKAIETSDCLLILGAFMSDINLGIGSAHLDVSKVIYATSERVAIQRHHYENVGLKTFIEGLAARPSRRSKTHPGKPAPPPKPFRPKPSEPITVRRFFLRMNEFIDDDTVVICDPGDSLFGAMDMTVHRRTEFMSPAYYTSMGFAVPAALGAQVRNPRLRPIVFVGDGAFQMTGQELSSIVRYGLDPIILVLNNKGYTTERFINDGPYNDIWEWRYDLWPQLLQAGWGVEVRTEGELEAALEHIHRRTGGPAIVNVHLDPYDCSEALKRLGSFIAPLAHSGATQ
ncbi:MAG: alpha-keto acid decarboxylase family protein [Nitrospiraceae bacterium]|nr:alpha-keto acid decarboxylase family protein [Nitrospiraceae bacterium]